MEKDEKLVIEREMDTVKKAAQPLVDLLRKKYTPMTTAIVTGAHVEILSTDVGVVPDGV